MMTRILFTAALSLTAMAPMAQAGMTDKNSAQLNGPLLSASWAGTVVAMPGQPLNLRSIGGGNPETRNGAELNGLQWNGWDLKNSLALNAITENAVAEAAHRAHLKGFMVHSVVLPDGTVVGW